MAVSRVPRRRTYSTSRVVADVRAWQIWTLRPAARGYLLAIMVLAVCAAGYACSRTIWRGSDLLLAAALLATSFAAVEAARPVGETHGGLLRDLAAVWLLPAAVLLPPAYALLMPFIITAYKIVRIPRGAVYWRFFSHCTMSLAYGSASVVFHALPASVAGSKPDSGRHALTWVLCVTAVGLLAHLVKHWLLIIAIKLDDPTRRARDLLFSRETATLDMLEGSIAVIVTLVLAIAGAVTLLLALPCVVYLKRSIAKAQWTLNARLDADTGLLNERAWRCEAEVTLLRVLRDKTPLAIVIVAIDNFADIASYADQAVPGQLISDVADAIQDQLPGNAVSGRTGTAQFSVLLTRAGRAEARHVAEGLRDEIAARTFTVGSGDHADWVFRLTISGGAAVLNPSTRARTSWRSSDLVLADLVGTAGSALDTARMAGSSTVCVATDDGSEAA